MTVVLHPGFLKTATTALQTKLFAAHPGLFFLGPGCAAASYPQITKRLRAVDGVDGDDAALGRAIAEAMAAQPKRTTLVLSDETLTANVYLVDGVARRLAAQWPAATVLFTIRSQFEAIPSFYARHGRVLTDAPAPYKDRHVRFDDWLDHAWRREPHGILGVFDYGRTIARFRRHFDDRIQVVLQEALATDGLHGVDHLATVLGLAADDVRSHLAGPRVHQRESAAFVRYDRLMKRFPRLQRLRRSVPGAGRVVGILRDHLASAPSDVRLPVSWRQRFVERFGPQNRRLAERYGLDLVRHGYP